MNNEVLRIENLSVEVPGTYGIEPKPILNNIFLELKEQECVGIIGGSGSGKSVLMSAIINSLKEPLVMTQGSVFLEGHNILELSTKDMRSKILGKQIASISPNPHWRLDPINTIGNQIQDIYMSHFKCSKEQAYDRTMELLKLVGIPDPETRYNAFPHELSGGMAQRILVTIALICEPKLLLADEPTGGLDVTIQIQVFNLIKKLIREEKRSTIVASRDIGLIYHLCDKVYVLYQGKIVESGPVDDVIRNPKHPYTARLVQISESSHSERRTEQYRQKILNTEKEYNILKSNIMGNKMVNGFLDVGGGHFVEVQE